MSQIAFAFASVVIASTPHHGRAESSPDRTEQLQHQREHEQPKADRSAVAAEFTEEEIAQARAWAHRVAREYRQRIARTHETPEAVERQLRYCALAEQMLLAELAAPVESDEPTNATEAEAEPPRPPKGHNPRAPRWASPRRARVVEESAAPVPAAPRRPQPTAAEVLAHRPLKPPPRRAGGAE